MSFLARLKKLTDYIYSPTNPASEDAIRSQIDNSIQEVYDNVTNVLTSVTDGSSGADNVAATAVGTGTAETTQGILEELDEAIGNKANLADVYLKTETYNQTEIDALDAQNVKIIGNQTVGGTKTFSSLPEIPTTPTLGVHPTSKLYVDNSILGIVVGTLPDGSITDDKLSNDPGQAKDNISKNETNIANLQIDVTNTKSRIFMLGGM